MLETLRGELETILDREQRRQERRAERADWKGGGSHEGRACI